MGRREVLRGVGLATALVLIGACAETSSDDGQQTVANTAAAQSTIETDSQGFVLTKQECGNGKKVTIKIGHLAVGQAFTEETNHGEVRVQAITTTDALITKTNGAGGVTVVIPTPELIPADMRTDTILRNGIHEGGPVTLHLKPGIIDFQPLATWGIENGDAQTGFINAKTATDGLDIKAVKGNC